MNPRVWLLFTLCRITVARLLTSEASESPLRIAPVASFLTTSASKAHYSGVFDKSRFKGVAPLQQASERSDYNSTRCLAFAADDAALYVGGSANNTVQVWDISYWTHQNYGTSSTTTTTTTTAWQSRTLRQEMERIKKQSVSGRNHPDWHPDTFSHGQDRINIENPAKLNPTPPPMKIGLEQTIDVGGRAHDLVMDDTTGTLFVATSHGHILSFDTRDVVLMGHTHIPQTLATQDVDAGAKVNKLALSSDGNFLCAVGTEKEDPAQAANGSFLESASAENGENTQPNATTNTTTTTATTTTANSNVTYQWVEQLVTACPRTCGQQAMALPPLCVASDGSKGHADALCGQRPADMQDAQCFKTRECKGSSDTPGWLRCYLTQHFLPPTINETKRAPVRVIERKLGAEPLALALSRDNGFIYTGGYDNLITKWRITGLTPSLVGSNVAMADIVSMNGDVKSLITTPAPQSYVVAGLGTGRADVVKMLRDTPLPEAIAFSAKPAAIRDKIDRENRGRDMMVGEFVHSPGSNPQNQGMGSVDAVDYIQDLDNKAYYVTAGWMGLPQDVDLHPPPINGDSPDNDLPPSGDNPSRLVFWTLGTTINGLPGSKKEFELERVGLNWVNSLKVSNDQNWIATGGNDGSLTLWSTVYMHQNKRAAFATYLDGKWKDTTPEVPDMDLTGGFGPRPSPAPAPLVPTDVNQDSLDDPAADVEPAPSPDPARLR